MASPLCARLLSYEELIAMEPCSLIPFPSLLTYKETDETGSREREWEGPRAGNAAGVNFLCSSRGRRAETRFWAAMSSAGWKRFHNLESFASDYTEHVDIVLGGTRECIRGCNRPLSKMLEKNELCEGETLKVLKVDVKSLRSIRRGGRMQNEFLFAEIHERGWLRGGKADVIAYEIWDSTEPQSDVKEGKIDPSVAAIFLLVDRKELARYIVGKIDWEAPFVPFPEECLYRKYRRENRKEEIITLIPLEDVWKEAGCGYAIARRRC
jgi:hypothetical protein